MSDKRGITPIKIGVVGCGKMGQNHIRILSEMSGIFDLIGFYDPDKTKEKVARSYGINQYVSYDEMLVTCDAVTIACPTSMHKEMALKAAKEGKHALVEKPIAEDLHDTQEIISAFKKNELMLTVGHVERYNPVVTTLCEILKSMDIVAIEIHRCSPFDSRIYDVDVVSDLMIHDIDILVNGIMEEYPLNIFAFSKSVHNSRFADYAHAVFSFSNGVNAFVTTSRATEDKIRMIVVHALGAYIEADMLNKSLTIKKGVNYELQHASYRQYSVTENVFVPLVEPLREELKNFGEAILGKKAMVIGGDQIIRAMQVLDTVKGIIYT